MLSFTRFKSKTFSYLKTLETFNANILNVQRELININNIAIFSEPLFYSNKSKARGYHVKISHSIDIHIFKAYLLYCPYNICFTIFASFLHLLSTFNK